MRVRATDPTWEARRERWLIPPRAGTGQVTFLVQRLWPTEKCSYHGFGHLRRPILGRASDPSLIGAGRAQCNWASAFDLALGSADAMLGRGMSTAQHMISLLRSHLRGDDREFLATAMQIAAHEAHLGHQRLADELKNLIDEAKAKQESGIGGSVLVMQARPDLAGLVSILSPEIRLATLVLPGSIRARLQRVIQEYRQAERLRQKGLQPRRRLLILGPPGTGKTMTASALAGELHLPLLSVLLEGVITKFMGESAAKLRLIFEAMRGTPGVYLFDEFDAIGARRDQRNDVGEIRRILNSFLQMMDADDSHGPIVAATNHPELLDPALFRRFDDVLEYGLPMPDQAAQLIRNRLASFSTENMDFRALGEATGGLSQAEIARACDEAAKKVILMGTEQIAAADVLAALEEMRRAYRPSLPGGGA